MDDLHELVEQCRRGKSMLLVLIRELEFKKLCCGVLCWFFQF